MDSYRTPNRRPVVVNPPIMRPRRLFQNEAEYNSNNSNRIIETPPRKKQKTRNNRKTRKARKTRKNA